MTAADDPFEPGQTIGSCEILREIGRGGMGRVYMAKDTAVGGRLVAIKVILAADRSEEAHARFLREVRNLARLRHSNIVTLFTAGHHQGRPYFVMDYVPGRDLTRFLDECVMLGAHERIAKVVKAIATVARAVHYAHSKGIVHRDLKPANILISHEDDEPMVLDFGIAKYLGDTALTQTDQAPGTPAYRAPEQVDIERKTRDELIDVWALGVILYRALTLTPPFRGNDALSVSMQVLNANPDRPRDLNPRISPALEDVILACLQKNPDRRPESALIVAELLEQALGDAAGPRAAALHPPENRSASATERASEEATTNRVASPNLETGTDGGGRSGLRVGRTWAVVAIVAVMAGGGVALWRFEFGGVGVTGPEHGPPGAPASAPGGTDQMALGVMLFKNIDGNTQHEWWREAFRDGLNTQLSQLSMVKVYSKEFIDLLITRKGLTEIEAARELGIRKMLSGGFVEKGGTLRIETHIVDVASGVLEASYTTSGTEPELPDLQYRLALGVISHLNLPVSAEEKKMLLAQGNTDVDALKLLIEAEGGGKGAPAKPADHPRSALPLWLALGARLLPTTALAEDVPDRDAIQNVLERYRRATELGDLQAIAALYAEFPPDQQAAQERYFANVRDLHVAIDQVEVVVVGDGAVASYNRVDDFVDLRTGHPKHLALRLTKTLRKEGGEWKLVVAQ